MSDFSPKAEQPNVSLIFTNSSTTAPETPSCHDSDIPQSSSCFSAENSSSTPASTSPSTEEATVPKIPRPPNAFMLYRSDFLKRKTIPASAEKRQQALSKVVGQCWNMLSDDEKGVWKERADEEMHKHKLLHPDYRFNPAPKGSRKAKAKNGQEGKDEDNTRKLRETYAGMAGPAPLGSRERRKQNSKRNKSHHVGKREALDTTFQQYNPLPDTVPPTTLSYASETGSGLPPNFPQPSYPHLAYDQPNLQESFPQYANQRYHSSETPADSTPSYKLETEPTASGCGLRLDPEMTRNDQGYQFSDLTSGLSTHYTYEHYQDQYQWVDKAQDDASSIGAGSFLASQEPTFTSPLTVNDQQSASLTPQVLLQLYQYEQGMAHQYNYNVNHLSTWDLGAGLTSTSNGEFWQIEGASQMNVEAQWQ